MNSVVMAMAVFVGAGLIAMAMVALMGAAIPVVGPRMLRPRPWRRIFWTKRWALPRGASLDGGAGESGATGSRGARTYLALVDRAPDVLRGCTEVLKNFA